MPEIFEEMLEFEEKVPPTKLLQAVTEAIDFLQRRTREMKDEMYSRYEEASRKGVPFREREKLIEPNKVAWCDKESARLGILRRDFKVKPLGQWYESGDILLAKQQGLRFFCAQNLDRII